MTQKYDYHRRAARSLKEWRYVLIYTKSDFKVSLARASDVTKL